MSINLLQTRWITWSRPGFPVVSSNPRNDTRDRFRGKERNRDAAVSTERFRNFNAWRNIAPVRLDVEIILRRYLRNLPWLRRSADSGRPMKQMSRAENSLIVVPWSIYKHVSGNWTGTVEDSMFSHTGV
ncbi:MAG: hypothetical protein OXL68_21615 [Paracoccaceae bacterium]|nr:hypothetical protein [Paracoccaceae bacterium]